MAGFGDALSGLGGTYGAILGEILTGGDRGRQRRSIEQEREMYASLPTDLQAYLEQLYDLGPSAFEGIREDPRLRAEQMKSLSGLREIADAGGMDPQARAALAEGLGASAAQNRAQQGALLDQFARGGGLKANGSLLANLTAQQANAQRAGMEGLQAAGDAANRRYQALMAAGQMAGGVRGQDYGVASDRARAMDEVSRYNAMNRQSVAGRNTDRQNRTAEGNIGRRYQQAGMVGGTYGNERDYWRQQEERKKRLAYVIGSAAGRNIGTGADFMTGGGMP